ncbi:MAG TPA: patatin-like phospholipase family protein [Solirubrobacteraceae bacterium]
MVPPPTDPRLAVQPVHWLPDDDPAAPVQGTGLCLSGGGYRAMLFHVGTLWRLNDAALLGKLDRVSSVSGGSITAATLALAWPDLAFGPDGRAADFAERVVAPVRGLAGETLDVASALDGMLPFGETVGEHLSGAYREHLFGDATLQSLPDAPRFVINATNLDSGELFRFTKTEMADWRVGTVAAPRVLLGDAVAASSAFPPVLSPFMLDLRDADWEGEPGNDLGTPEHRGELTLSDGGVYDNMGLETVWKRCATVLVSDAGGHLADDPDTAHDWARLTLRVLHVIDNQVRSLRKRQAISSFADGQRKGAYWGIRSHVTDYGLADPLDCPPEATERLADVATRLSKTPPELQEQLVNWGYAACDTALRAHVDPALPRGTFPYPGRGVG